MEIYLDVGCPLISTYEGSGGYGHTSLIQERMFEIRCGNEYYGNIKINVKDIKNNLLDIVKDRAILCFPHILDEEKDIIICNPLPTNFVGDPRSLIQKPNKSLSIRRYM